MSNEQALRDALQAVEGKLGSPSVHCGHVTFAETEEWPSVDLNVRMSANRVISTPISRWINAAANTATIRALLDELDELRAKQALALPTLSPEQQGYVPLSDDCKSVFVDGIGEVPLALPTAAQGNERAAVLAEREACIEIVARHGGSIEIEAAIRARGTATLPLLSDDEMPPLPSNAALEERIKTLMKGCGLPDSQSVYGAFKQFQNELMHETVAYGRAVEAAVRKQMGVV